MKQDISHFLDINDWMKILNRMYPSVLNLTCLRIIMQDNLHAIIFCKYICPQIITGRHFLHFNNFMPYSHIAYRFITWSYSKYLNKNS